ncbi:MAG: VOC family protein [Acidimicrobiales bacterium]
MKVTRIMHSSVNVAGTLGEAETFYRDVLGLSPAPRPEIPGVGGRWFTADDAQIHLVDAPCTGSGIDPTGPHVCLGVDDLGSAVAELESLGLETFSADSQGIVQVWFCDPAGNTIELQEDGPGR